MVLQGSQVSRDTQVLAGYQDILVNQDFQESLGILALEYQAIQALAGKAVIQGLVEKVDSQESLAFQESLDFLATLAFLDLAA